MTVDIELTKLLGAFAAVAHVAIACAVTFHVLLNKRNVGAAVSWIGIAWLSPFFGGLLYVTLGVNRVQRRARRLRRKRGYHLAFDVGDADDAAVDPLKPLDYAIGRLTGLPTEPGNAVELMRNGDEAYPKMLAEIDRARTSVGLTSYIFRADKAGNAFIDALIAARARGVEVRVLIDGVGSGYFWSAAYGRLHRAGVPVARFLHSYLPWRTPFLNLRNHRKLLVIDGRVGFTGGLNIGAENLLADNPPHPVRDTHFRFEGPVVAQLTEAFADDWLFETSERLKTNDWFPTLHEVGTIAARVITSGPDGERERIEYATLQAIACARRSIRVVTPYFLPPDVLTTALGLAALRGVAVDLLVPECCDHPILDWARRVPLRTLVEAGCRVWLLPSPFEHSKLMVIDDSWSLIGSANWDTRSFRLNFELNVEVLDADFALRIVEAARGSHRLTLADLKADSLAARLRNGAARLLQPYL